VTLGGLELQEAPVAWTPSHRVIASEYAGENLFDRLVDATELEALQQIADLTSPPALSQMGAIALVKVDDRIYGHGSGLIMAAFTWPGQPSRFSDGSRGTYYAANTEDTAVDETKYHDELFLSGRAPIVVEKTLLHADVHATLVDIRSGCPAPADVYHPVQYTAGQSLGRIIRLLDGYGLIYDSVRHPRGECVAIFRPPALANAQPARTLHYHWDGHRIARVT
jgi:hypothetical protein